jgi:hypothetical protein
MLLFFILEVPPSFLESTKFPSVSARTAKYKCGHWLIGTSGLHLAICAVFLATFAAPMDL